jgi:hypothetical protein
MPPEQMLSRVIAWAASTEVSAHRISRVNAIRFPYYSRNAYSIATDRFQPLSPYRFGPGSIVLRDYIAAIQLPVIRLKFDPSYGNTQLVS